MKNQRIRVAVFVVIILSASITSFAMKNPATVYCMALGYEYLVEETPDGVRGVCVLSDGMKVDAWAFLLGEIAPDRGYCGQRSHAQRTVKDQDICIKFLTESCAVCVLPDGREVEVTELMGLNFDETTCGDGICGIPETPKTCPADCSASRFRSGHGTGTGTTEQEPESSDPDRK